MDDAEWKEQGIGKTHGNIAGLAQREKDLIVDEELENERLRGDVVVATIRRAAQITK